MFSIHWLGDGVPVSPLDEPRRRVALAAGLGRQQEEGRSWIEYNEDPPL